jgi:hypothetical protein
MSYEAATPMRLAIPVSASALVLLAAFGCSSSNSQPSGSSTSDAGAAPEGGQDFPPFQRPDPDSSSPAPAPPRDAEAPPLPGVARGPEKFVEMFPIPAGLVIVHSEAVVLIDSAGTVLQRWSPGREITTASFDGATLAVADRAVVTALDLNLAVLSTTPLTETCAASALITGKRFVCGQKADWDRIFYVYDLTTSKLLSASPKANNYTYRGIPMRAVPGTNTFLTVSTAVSPKDFNLFSVDANQAVIWEGESPYHGDFPISEVYAFGGSPVSHVIAPDGTILRISGDPNPQGSIPRFIKDGNLGLSRSDEPPAVGLDQAGGQVYALMPKIGPGGPIEEDEKTFTLELRRVNLEQRTVESSRALTLARASVLSFKHDPTLDRAWVVFDDNAQFTIDPKGYRIQLLDY